MIIAQFDFNTDAVSLFEADFYKIDKDGKIVEFRHKNRVFKREEIKSLNKQGFLYGFIGYSENPLMDVNLFKEHWKQKYGDEWKEKVLEKQMGLISNDESE